MEGIMGLTPDTVLRRRRRISRSWNKIICHLCVSHNSTTVRDITVKNFENQVKNRTVRFTADENVWFEIFASLLKICLKSESQKVKIYWRELVE